MNSEFTWTCPECRRHVPSRVNKCRCGHQREISATGTADGNGHPLPGSSSDPRTRLTQAYGTIFFFAGLSVVSGAIGVLFQLQSALSQGLSLFNIILGATYVFLALLVRQRGSVIALAVAVALSTLETLGDAYDVFTGEGGFYWFMARIFLLVPMYRGFGAIRDLAASDPSGAYRYAVSRIVLGTVLGIVLFPLFFVAAAIAPVQVAGRTGVIEGTLVWVDREGRATPVTEDRGRWVYPRVAPDGTRVAVTEEEPNGREHVWILDTERGTRTRLTVDESRDLIPVWAPDGTRVAFRSERGGGGNLYWKQADGSSEAEPLLTSDVLKSPTAWSPDGQVLLFYEVGGPRDIFTLPLDGDRTPSPWRVTTFDEHGATFSPDGRWIVYASDESGRDEVYVQPYPGPGERTTVSTTGGDEPVWSGDGREIFYRSGDQMMVVDVETQPTFTAGRPTVLFEGQYVPMPGNSGSRNYDVAPDGRFVMIHPETGLPFYRGPLLPR